MAVASGRRSSGSPVRARIGLRSGSALRALPGGASDEGLTVDLLGGELQTTRRDMIVLQPGTALAADPIGAARPAAQTIALERGLAGPRWGCGERLRARRDGAGAVASGRRSSESPVLARIGLRGGSALRALTGDDTRDEGLAVDLLGGEAIVRTAEDATVLGIVAAAHTAGDDMVVLQPGAALAADAVGAAPRAAEAVAFEHGAAGRAGDVARGSR